MEPPAITTTPARMMGNTPKRAISEPVMNPGPYMPTTCQDIAVAANAKGNAQKSIASGVAVIRRFMRP